MPPPIGYSVIVGENFLSQVVWNWLLDLIRCRVSWNCSPWEVGLSIMNLLAFDLLSRMHNRTVSKWNEKQLGSYLFMDHLPLVMQEQAQKTKYPMTNIDADFAGLTIIMKKLNVCTVINSLQNYRRFICLAMNAQVGIEWFSPLSQTEMTCSRTPSSCIMRTLASPSCARGPGRSVVEFSLRLHKVYLVQELGIQLGCSVFPQ